ncbi:MAG TPA: aldehyde dehydrogenase family protein [Nocardioidaceae bacterium]|nr:aldehyde dehydrogenase family protein [Nocardioidaceae bacterium]
MDDQIPLFVAGSWEAGEAPLEVRNPYDGSLFTTTSYATVDQVERAVAAAHAAREAAAALPLHARADTLLQISCKLEERTDDFVHVITSENGKPVTWARAEVGRAVSVFRWAAEETRRWSGETIRLDTDRAAEGRMAYVSRVPKGPVLAISPFNFPLNLVAHKVAPALAVGAPVVLKPAPKTPVSALLLARVIARVMRKSDLPDGMLSVVNVENERASGMVQDPRLPVVSFTGSGPVGAAIQAAVPGKHVVLELGGNAAAVVCADWDSEPDLAFAAERIAAFSNYQAGQSCIGVQRVYAVDTVYETLRKRVVAAVESLGTGDPKDPATHVGPMIDEAAARRVEEWVGEAVARGGRVLTGGVRQGSTYAPTVLENVPPDAKVVREEVFGPVLVLERVASTDEAFARVNDSRYGLQAGVFTHDLQTAFRAHRELEVGGVVIGDVPSFRADQMPYGGTKESGVGREGVRSTMTDLTYERVLVLTGLSL